MVFPKFISNLFLLFVTLMVVCGCGKGSSESTTAVTPESPAEATALALATQIMDTAASHEAADFTPQLQEAQRTWAKHNIDDYTFVVWYSQPNWNTQVLNITVIDGVVTDSSHTCIPVRTCIMRDVDPTQFTIDKLLVVAENVNNLGLPATDVSLTFSQEYGYPTFIGYPDAFFNPSSFQPIDPPE